MVGFMHDRDNVHVYGEDYVSLRLYMVENNKLNAWLISCMAEITYSGYYVWWRFCMTELMYYGDYVW